MIGSRDEEQPLSEERDAHTTAFSRKNIEQPNGQDLKQWAVERPYQEYLVGWRLHTMTAAFVSQSHKVETSTEVGQSFSESLHCDSRGLHRQHLSRHYDERFERIW